MRSTRWMTVAFSERLSGRARTTCRFVITLLLLLFGAPQLSAVVAAEPFLRRVGHSHVRPACISDGSARMQHYWDVAAFDWGGVIPLNSWYHPQRMHFDPKTAVLQPVALALPHDGQGNEDDPRQRLFAHKGDSANSSSVFFTIFGYEEIDDENGRDHRDSAVMSLRPSRLPGTIRMPRRHARVVNLGAEESKRGQGAIPAHCGSPYDQSNRIVFVPRQRPAEFQSRELFQMYRFDPASNRLLGRSAYRMPKSFTRRHWTTCMAADSRYGLIAVGARTPWSPPGRNASLHVLSYRPTGDKRIAEVHSPLTTDSLTIRSGDRRYAARPSCAAFCDDGRDVYLLLGGSGPEVRYGGETEGVVLVFRLGPIGGPYRLEAPFAAAPIPHGVEQLKIDSERVFVSSRGLHTIWLEQLLRHEGIGDERLFDEHYALPYDSHGFDFATIHGRRFAFLACGRNGLDVFELGAKQSEGGASNAKPARDDNPWKRLRGPRVRDALTTGADYRQLGTPAINAAGDVVCWAVTRDGRESIALMQTGKPPKRIAVAGAVYRSFGRPVINSAGEVAFFAGKANGGRTVVVWEQGRLRERVDSSRFRSLREPRLADDGSVVFACQPANRLQRGRLILRVSRDGETRTIFDEAKSDFRLGTGIHGDFEGDYDISPDGRRVAWIVRESERLNNRLLVWANGAVHDLGSPGRDMQLIRFGGDGRSLSFRRWKDEVLAACHARLQIDKEVVAIKDVREVARRRSVYGRERVNPGEFIGARADAVGNTVAAVVEHVQSGEGARCLGGQIWRYNSDNDRVQFLARPLDLFGKRVVLNVAFIDSVNRRGAVAARIDWKPVAANNDSLGQSIVVWPVGSFEQAEKER